MIGIIKSPYKKIDECHFFNAFFNNSNTMYFTHYGPISGSVNWGSKDTTFYSDKVILDLIKNKPIYVDKNETNYLNQYFLKADGTKQYFKLANSNETDFGIMIAKDTAKHYSLYNSNFEKISDNYDAIYRKSNIHFANQFYYMAIRGEDVYLLDTLGNRKKLPFSHNSIRSATIHPYKNIPIILYKEDSKQYAVHMETMETMETMEILFEADDIHISYTANQIPLIYLRHKADRSKQLYFGSTLLSDKSETIRALSNYKYFKFESDEQLKLIDYTGIAYPIKCSAVDFGNEHLFILKHQKINTRDYIYSVYIKSSGKQFFFKIKPEILEKDQLIKGIRNNKYYYFTLQGKVLFELNS